MGQPLIYSRLTIWMVVLLSPAVYAQGVCDVGWFGSQCQYKCHCTNNNCDNNGDCTDGDTCVKGWFGPQCQYVDLTYTENDGTTKAVFTDADDTTCNDNITQNDGILTLSRAFPVTWLRLHFSIEGVLQDVIVEFSDSSTGVTYQCNNKRNSVVDSRTIDIYCDIDAEVDKVAYTGRAVGYLCSIYLSGGRNIALKQSQVSQSSTYTKEYSSVASNAVDGNIDQDYASGSCTHTSGREDPYWNVEFAQISDVNRYVIYNRGSHQSRLKGFVLTSFDQSSAQVFENTDQTTTPQSVYMVTTATNTSSIKRVNIIATAVENILTLCEVEIYGDSQCPAEKYGRECDQDCNCALNEPCFVGTGVCPSGCAAGYIGEHCDQSCPPGTYGQNCALTCSVYCQDQLKCDLISGRCEECVPGKQGDLCDSDCPPTKYGPRCIHECSTNCYNQQCEQDTGTCIQCPPGKKGSFCDKDCPPTHYGPRCINLCNPNCLDNRCAGASGRCLDCPAGKTGDQCDQECPATTYGQRCIHNCSRNCSNNKCDGATGVCDQCPVGKSGDQCNKECSAGRYGVNCSLQCSTTCADQRCAPATGDCIACKDGYRGPLCDTLCKHGKYGQSCSKECSQFCITVNGTGDNESPCHHVTGTCIYGCLQGYEGLSCQSEKQSSSPGLGVGLGIGLGVAALVVIISVTIYCYRRRSEAQKTRRERPPGYDPADPTTDEHNYNELFESADDYTLPTDMVSSSKSPTSPPENMPQDTVQYVNADVGHYEDFGHVTSNRESEGHFQKDISQQNVAVKDNTEYANV